MTEYLSAGELAAAADGGIEDVTLPSGGKVRVRGLSRHEWFLVGKAADGDPNSIEIGLIAMAMVEPKLTKQQAEAFRKAPGRAADVAKLSNKIRELTGLAEGAEKSDMVGDGDGTGR